MTRSRQRWRLMSLRSPSGKFWIKSISSSPCIAAQLQRWKCRTLFLKWCGNCLRCIHHSMSRYFSCIFFLFAMIECRNIYTITHTFTFKIFAARPNITNRTRTLCCQNISPNIQKSYFKSLDCYTNNWILQNFRMCRFVWLTFVS